MQKIEVGAAIAYIETIDFSMLLMKLTHRRLGSGWSQEKALRVEREYRNYLIMILKNLTSCEVLLPPTHDVDEFWHGHILDTKKYVQDCMKIFGRYLHHYPYFGMRGEADEVALKEAFKTTDAIYRSEFGEQLKSKDAEAVSAAQ